MAETSDRRGFLEWVIKGSALVMGAVTVIPGVGMLLAPVINRPKPKTRKVVFAAPRDLDSVTFVAARLEGADETAPGVFYKRGADGKPVVLSALCTHSACTVNWKPAENRFHCPCHQGYFDAEGKNVSGPPPRPLIRLTVTEKAGDIFVEEPEA